MGRVPGATKRKPLVSGAAMYVKTGFCYYLLKCRNCGEKMFIKLATTPGKTARRKCECGEVAVIKATRTDGRDTAEIVSGNMEPG